MEGFSALSGDDSAGFLGEETALLLQGSWDSSEVAEADFDAVSAFPPWKRREFPPQIGGIAAHSGSADLLIQT